MKRKPIPVVSAAIAQAAAQIQAAEDKHIFDLMDAIASQCSVKTHEAFGKHISECLEPECVAAYVHDS